METQVDKNETMLPRYTLTEDNFHVLQSMVFKHAAVIRRTTGVGKGRAQIEAENYVATERVDPPLSGQALSTWLGQARNRAAVQGKFSKAVPTPVKETPKLDVAKPIKDNDTFRGRGSTDQIAVQMAAYLQDMKPGDVYSFPVASAEEAKELGRHLNKVSKMLNWALGNNKRSYLKQIYPDRLKIKRVKP